MLYLILGILILLIIVFHLYPVAVLISTGLIILIVAYKVSRVVSKQCDKQHRRAMELSAEQRKNAREARLQQAHYEKMRKQNTQ